jgi:hypothetical protein
VRPDHSSPKVELRSSTEVIVLMAGFVDARFV